YECRTRPQSRVGILAAGRYLAQGPFFFVTRPGSRHSLRRALALVRSRAFRRTSAVVLGLGGLVAAILSVRHFLRSGWPLTHADPWLVLAAGALFFGAYAFKAFGWRRLFARHERPSAQALAAATGAATVTGIALPGRFDDLVRVTV